MRVSRRVFLGALTSIAAGAAPGAAEEEPAAVWRTVGRLPYPNHDLAYAVLNGRAYVAGGMAFVGEREEHHYYAALFVWNPDDTRWDPLPSMGRPRALAGMTAANGRLWVAGGRSGDGPPTYLDSSEVYDPRENRWRDLPPMSTSRTEPAVAASGGRLLVAGGAGPADQELATCESYDLRRGGHWRPEPPMPTARRGIAAVAARDRVWVVGGGRELESFDPDTREWSRHAPMQAARFSPGVALFRGKLWVLGGNGVKGQQYTSEIYDFERDRWSRGPDLPRRMAWFAAFPLEDRLHIAGGLRFDETQQRYLFFDETYRLVE